MHEWLATGELDRECVELHGESTMSAWRKRVSDKCVAQLVGWKQRGQCCLMGAVAQLYLSGQGPASLYLEALVRRYLDVPRERHRHDWRGLLEHAVVADNLQMAEALLANGADANLPVPRRYPVTVVWDTYTVEMRELLIEHGADPNLHRGLNGLCGYYLAVGGPSSHMLSLLPHVRSGLLHVFPCDRQLLETEPHGRNVLLAHEACRRDLATQIGVVKGLLPELRAIVLDYMVPADPSGSVLLGSPVRPSPVLE